MRYLKLEGGKTLSFSEKNRRKSPILSRIGWMTDFKRLFWLELDDLVEDYDDDPHDFDADEDLEDE